MVGLMLVIVIHDYGAAGDDDDGGDNADIFSLLHAGRCSF